MHGTLGVRDYLVTDGKDLRVIDTSQVSGPEHLAALGLAPGELNVVLEYPSNEAIRAAVEAGSGATVISRRVVDSAIRGGTSWGRAAPSTGAPAATSATHSTAAPRVRPGAGTGPACERRSPSR